MCSGIVISVNGVIVQLKCSVCGCQPTRTLTNAVMPEIGQSIYIHWDDTTKTNYWGQPRERSCRR